MEWSARHCHYWITSILGLIVIIICVGGITRLTESGLSMVEWRPLIGSLPPLTASQWDRVYTLYQHTPQFALNSTLSLAHFKWIFFWEYLHRMLARLLGLTVMVTYLWGRWTKRLPRPLHRPLLISIGWVVLQGIAGWFMVKSGLINQPRVSHIRLAIHLGLAFGLFAYLCWIRFSYPHRPTATLPRRLLPWLSLCTLLLVLQLVYGAFTAGLDAGYTYNTFPKMGGQWVPDSLWLLSPLSHNIMNNPFMVQWLHRILAGLFGLSVFALASLTPSPSRRPVYVLIAGCLFQVGIGIATLCSYVLLPLAVLHQLGAVGLIAITTYLWRHISFIVAAPPPTNCKQSTQSPGLS